MKSHAWVKINNDVLTIGITEYAQESLGDLVFIELPEIDAELKIDEECATLESVKTASDIYSPANGTVIEINENLEEQPELINESPYNDGWMFKMKVIDISNNLSNLISADEYNTMISEE
jgi:glycine cleavage system H protein